MSFSFIHINSSVSFPCRLLQLNCNIFIFCLSCGLLSVVLEGSGWGGGEVGGGAVGGGEGVGRGEVGGGEVVREGEVGGGEVGGVEVREGGSRGRFVHDRHV